jgi:hypothetical protein
MPLFLLTAGMELVVQLFSGYKLHTVPVQYIVLRAEEMHTVSEIP